MRIAICCTLCAALWRVWGPPSISSKLSKYKSTPLKLFPCLCGGCSVCKICKWIFQVEVLYHCWNILDILPLSSNMLQSTFIKSTNRIRRSGHLQFKQTKIEMVQSCKTWWQCLLYPFLAFSTQNPTSPENMPKTSWHVFTYGSVHTPLQALQAAQPHPLVWHCREPASCQTSFIGDTFYGFMPFAYHNLKNTIQDLQGASLCFCLFSVMYCTIKFRLSQSLPGLPVLLITTDKYLRQARFPDLGGSIASWLRWQESALQIKKQDAKSCKRYNCIIGRNCGTPRWVRMNIHWLPSDCSTASAAAVSSANGSSRLRSSAAGTSCHHVETNTIAWNSCTCWPLRQTQSWSFNFQLSVASQCSESFLPLSISVPV